MATTVITGRVRPYQILMVATSTSILRTSIRQIAGVAMVVSPSAEALPVRCRSFVSGFLTAGTAVDLQNFAGHVTCEVASEEEKGVRDVARFADAAKWNRFNDWCELGFG